MEILYNDPEIVVCIKPVGLDSQTGVPNQIQQKLNCNAYPVHRLDQNVGGVMVYAKTQTAAAMLSKAIQDGKMVKEYLAMVHGIPPESDTWQDFLFKDSQKNKVFVVKKERKGVKKASLEFQRLTSGETSLVHIRLHTGRSHQIRVQFASRGYPLVGDHKYGSRDDRNAPMLFSYRITFPWKGKVLAFEAIPDWAANI